MVYSKQEQKKDQLFKQYPSLFFTCATMAYAKSDHSINLTFVLTQDQFVPDLANLGFDANIELHNHYFADLVDRGVLLYDPDATGYKFASSPDNKYVFNFKDFAQYQRFVDNLGSIVNLIAFDQDLFCYLNGSLIQMINNARDFPVEKLVNSILCFKKSDWDILYSTGYLSEKAQAVFNLYNLNLQKLASLDSRLKVMRLPNALLKLELKVGATKFVMDITPSKILQRFNGLMVLPVDALAYMLYRDFIYGFIGYYLADTVDSKTEHKLRDVDLTLNNFYFNSQDQKSANLNFKASLMLFDLLTKGYTDRENYHEVTEKIKKLASVVNESSQRVFGLTKKQIIASFVLTLTSRVCYYQLYDLNFLLGLIDLDDSVIQTIYQNLLKPAKLKQKKQLQAKLGAICKP